MKKYFNLMLFGLMFITAQAFAKVVGFDPQSTFETMAPTVVALPLLNQQAERELIKQFRHDNSWLSELRSKNEWVNNDVIKIPRRGAAPEVLINNTIYPIDKSQRSDDHIILSLNKYDTENTVVTADELYALPYEKVSDVQAQHRETLEDVTARHALHSLAPNANSAKTPVLATTGANDGTGRLRLTSADLINFKKRLDKLNVPKMGRVLVLCPEHVADLLDEDRKFYSQYHSATNGVISANYYGFKIYESNYCPTYTSGNAKVAFDAADGPKVSSICFYKNTAMKATGTVQRFARPAEQDPEFRQNTMGFRLWFVAVAVKDEGLGAIVS